MPRFHFNTDCQDDVDGIDLPSLAVAKCDAMKLAAQIICDESETFWDKAQWGLTVTDAAGLTLFHIEVLGTESAAIGGGRARLASSS